jgi:hypothetical protein
LADRLEVEAMQSQASAVTTAAPSALLAASHGTLPSAEGDL